MFFLFLTGLVLALLGFFAAALTKNAAPAFLGAFVFVILFLVSSTGTVDTKNVGVVTSFKKPTGETKSAGAYFKAPWKDVTDMSLAWQTENYKFEVQAAGGATVGLDIRPRWRMVESAAPELFQNYKDFDGVINNLFKTELVDASNDLFSAYNPLTSYDVKTSLPVKSKEAWAQELRFELEKRLAGKLQFDRVAVTTISPDPKSQEKLNQQIEAFGRGKVLDQESINTDKENEITRKKANADVITRCLEIAEKVGGQPGLCLTNGSGVIVNSGK